ncbi:MAG: methylmalonyl-CoA mutase [Rhodospirillaceae bacterium]|nr:MAG: methylmalonyl-CoA mutase [Rhodospirillaceae bacterium]
MSLAAEFPHASHETWLKLVDKILGGVPFDKKLVSRTYDGLAIQPLYTRADWDGDADPSGYPGRAPYVRGNTTLGTHGGWDMRQLHRHPDPDIANRQILEDLERGITSIALRIDPTGEDGICVRNQADLDAVLKGMLLDLAPVALDPSPASLPVAAMLMEVLARHKVKDFAGNFGFDPLGVLASHGVRLVAADKALVPALAPLADAAAHVAKAYPKARTLNVTTLPYHSAGATDAQELGLALAAAADYLRALTGGGLSIDAACEQMAFTLAADADMFLTIAKFRAMRRLWARVAEACGATHRTAPLTARTAPRMMSRRDPWVNILRTTVACFSAGIAGAEAVTVLPFDHALGLPQALARRVARNTQAILQEESGLARVVDPVGGAWLFEKLTDDLATAAWSFFQKIEAAGGMMAALMSGFVADEIAGVRAERMKNIARRKDALTGISEFPNIDEAPVKAETADRAAILKARDPGTPTRLDTLPQPGGGGLMAALRAAVKNAATVAAVGEALAVHGHMTLPPLPQIRLGQEFETFRDAGDAYAAKFGARPKIFLASLGTIAEFTARAGFAKNLFEAGGIATVDGTGGTDPAAIAEDFRHSKSELAVICGTDALYGAHAVALATALRKAGAGMIYLAGRGGDAEAALRAAGVDGFIYMGCDVAAVLKDIHGRLEAA